MAGSRPSAGDSAPNFDFLRGDSGIDAGEAEAGGWSPPESSVNLLDPPADGRPTSPPDEDTVEVEPPPPAEPKPKSRAKSSKPRSKPAKSKQPAAAAPPPKQSKPKRKTKPAGEDGPSPGPDIRIEGNRALLLLSYAGAMTLITLWALWSLRGGSAHQLESLPDVPPVSPEAFRYYDEAAAMPAGHTLPLGESKQYGHVRVEPLRVTREKVSLTHYSGDKSLRPPGGGETVLKLHLRLTNESGDQKFAPLDKRLVYDRRVNADDTVLANQFIVPKSEKGTAEPNVLMYDLSPDGEWDVAGQPLPVLNPGESVETVLAAGPRHLDQLKGICLWRVLLRKGHNESTGHGVLTLIEVPFAIGDVAG